MNEILAAGEDGVIPGMVDALNFQIKSWARRWKGLDIKVNFKVEPVGDGIVIVSYGAFNMDKVKEKHATTIREVLIYFESKIISWEPHKKMQKLFTELKSLKLSLQDELAIVTLRRIVPGHCKYCPM